MVQSTRSRSVGLEDDRRVAAVRDRARSFHTIIRRTVENRIDGEPDPSTTRLRPARRRFRSRPPPRARGPAIIASPQLGGRRGVATSATFRESGIVDGRARDRAPSDASVVGKSSDSIAMRNFPSTCEPNLPLIGPGRALGSQPAGDPRWRARPPVPAGDVPDSTSRPFTRAKCARRKYRVRPGSAPKGALFERNGLERNSTSGKRPSRNSPFAMRKTSRASPRSHRRNDDPVRAGVQRTVPRVFE